MKKTISVLVASLAVSLIASDPVSATTYRQEPSNPPVITKIVSKKINKKFASITIYAKRNNYNVAVAPTPNIKVMVGKKSCVIKKSFGSCTISSVKLNTSVSVSAYQFNKYGKGQKTSKRIKANSNTKVYYQTRGTSRYIPTKGTVLAASTGKLSEIQSFNKAPSARTLAAAFTAAANQDRVSAAAVDPSQVTFDLSDAVALAKPADSTGGPGFYKLLSNGSQVNPVVTGNITVANFYIAPSDKVYALLAGSQPLVSGGPRCLLVEIDPTTGVPTCIDSSLGSIKWPYSQPGVNTEGILPPQFNLTLTEPSTI
jgi:hypothetical protein